MKDLYLKATSKQQVIDLLASDGLEFTGNYFGNEKFALDWIGKMPKNINEDTGNVTSWFGSYRFNVRLIEEKYTLFDDMLCLHPETPYRTFS